MLIREAHKNDFEAVCGLVPTKEDLFLVYPKGDFPLTSEQLHFLSQSRKDLMVGIENNQVIGFANLYDLEPGQWAFIGNVVIDQKYRGRGFGRQIVEYMINLIFEKYNLPEARISVFSYNKPALSLYFNFGFCQYQKEIRQDPRDKNTTLIHMRLKKHNHRR